jgi:hypothetical protein
MFSPIHDAFARLATDVPTRPPRLEPPTTDPTKTRGDIFGGYKTEVAAVSYWIYFLERSTVGATE